MTNDSGLKNNDFTNYGVIDCLSTDGATGLDLSLGFLSSITCKANGNVGIGTSSPSNKLDVNGNTFIKGRCIVNDGTDGGTSRGIMLWSGADTNWGIYMSQSGAGKSFSGGTACTGYGFAQHAVRFRAYNNTVNGFIFENSSETCLLSVRSSDAYTYMAGDLNIAGTYRVNGVSIGRNYGPLSGTRTLNGPPTYFYEYDITSVNYIFTFGQNMRLIDVLVYDSTDWNDGNVIYGRFHIRISDYAGFTQVSYTITSAGSVSCSAINFNTIRVATNRSGYPLIIVNSLLP